MFSIKLFTTFALFALAYASCPGCPEKADVSPELLKNLKFVVKQQNSNDEIVKVLSATSQVVAGFKYNVEFVTINQATKVQKRCSTEYVVQSWISEEPQILSYQCKPQREFNLESIALEKEICAGCPTKHDPKEYDVTNYLKKVLLSFDSDDKITKVISVTTQVVSGVKYTVEFESQNPQTLAKQICKTEFISQPWVSKIPQVLSFKCVKSVQKRSLDEHAEFKQVCAGCPTKHDPKEYDITEPLQKVLLSQDSDDKITKVISVTTQIVSGVKYTVEFEGQNPQTLAKRICKTEFISQPWISKMPQVLSFKCVKSVQKRSLDNDNIGPLKEVLLSQNFHDKVTKVISVSTQIESGIKFTIEFESQNPKTDAKQICKTEFINKPWVSKVPQVLSFKCVKKVQKRSLDERAVFNQICAGCPTKHDPKDYDVTENLQKVLLSQDSDDKVTKVISVTTQVVSGIKYTVEFESLNPTTNAKHICKTEFVSQPWVSKMPQVLKFQCSPLASLTESVVEFFPCFGCETEQDPKSYDIVPMLKTVMVSENSDDKIIKVTKITTQVVSGIKYKVEFESENVLKSIFHKCKTEFISAPWESKMPQVLSYKCV